jgi:hypothetical protein
MPGLFEGVVRSIIAFVVLPNLFFFVINRFYFLDRPIINLDYAVLGGVWLWLPVWVRVGSFAVFFIADVVTSTGSMYNINPIAGVVALFRAPIGLIITVIIVFAVTCALAAGIGALLNRFVRGQTARFIASALTMVVVLALILGIPLRSSIAKFTTDIVERDRGYRTTPDRMAAATDDLREDVKSQRDNVALVVVESWGVLADDDAQRKVLALFDTPALRQRYHVRTGSVAFRGGTTSGELRELCGVFTDYLVLNDQTITQCLPNQLKRRGFSTTALHGYKSEYYSRHRWYPRLFDRMLFEDSLQGGARCGTQFRGICDRDVVRTFKREIQRPGSQPRFTYWLTIDAHTPVDVERLPELPRTGFTSADCGPPDFCLVVFFWRETLAHVASVAADPATPRTRFIIVGDHAPAFVLQSRARRLLRGFVPFVELVPR